MVNKRKVPSLSTDKFISERVLKLDVLYAYFLASEFSQSNIYRGNISSLKYILKEDSTDAYSLTGDVNKVLETFLERYFSKVEVYSELNKNGAELNVSIKVTDQDGAYSTLVDSLDLVDGRLDTYASIDSLLKR